MFLKKFWKISILFIILSCFICSNIIVSNADILTEAKTAIDGGKLKEAISMLKESLEEDETVVEVHKLLGIALFKKKNYLQSREEFEYCERHTKKDEVIFEEYYKTMNEVSAEKYKVWEKLRSDDANKKKAHNALFMAFRLDPELGKKQKGDMNAAMFYWRAKMDEKIGASVLYRLGYLNEIKGRKMVASDYYAQMLDYVEDNSKLICIIDRYDYLNKSETEKFVQAITKFTEKKAEFLEKIKEADLTANERDKIMDFVDGQELLSRKIEKCETDEERQNVIQDTILSYKDKYKDSNDRPSVGLKKFIEKEKENTGQTKEEILKEWRLESLADEL